MVNAQLYISLIFLRFFEVACDTFEIGIGGVLAPKEHSVVVRN